MYFRIQNATVSVTNVSDAQGSTKLLAQTTLRNMIGTKNLSEILMDREGLSAQMQVSHCERCLHNLHSDVAGNVLRILRCLICTQMPQRTYLESCTHKLHSDVAGNVLRILTYLICTQMPQVTYWESCTHKLHSDVAGNILRILTCLICTQMLQVI